jgi:uncharacterized protein YjiS (DUF1127 family)
MPRTQTQTLPFNPRASLVQRVLRAIVASIERRRDRVLLSRLDDHLLRDIGLLPEEAKAECAKPIWRA